MGNSTSFIWGIRPVQEWLDSKLPIKCLYVSRDASGKSIQTLLSIAEKRGVPVKRAAPQHLEQLSGTRKHQNIVAKVKLPGYVNFSDLLKHALEQNEPPLIAILDNVQDPHNLGAILRSADAAGFHGVIIPRDKAAGLTATVIKTSAGASAHVPIARVTNIARTVETLKKEGFWITGTSQDSERDYHDVDFNGPSAIVMGSEGTGMRRLVREKCDFLVCIPMYGHVNSLNVSVAAGLMFFTARHQRQQQKHEP